MRPGLATTGGPLILGVVGPYARKGVLWDLHRRHYGADGDPLILVARGASRIFNPTLQQRVVDRALAYAVMRRRPPSTWRSFVSGARTNVRRPEKLAAQCLMTVFSIAGFCRYGPAWIIFVCYSDGNQSLGTGAFCGGQRLCRRSSCLGPEHQILFRPIGNSTVILCGPCLLALRQRRDASGPGRCTAHFSSNYRKWAVQPSPSWHASNHREKRLQRQCLHARDQRGTGFKAVQAVLVSSTLTRTGKYHFEALTG